MKKKIVSLLILVSLVLSMMVSVEAKNKKVTKPGAVSQLSISVTDTQTDFRTYMNTTITWKKVQGAKGYQVRLIGEKAYRSGQTIVYSTGESTTNTITIPCPSAQVCDSYYAQVRAYKTKKGGARVYGKWSTSIFPYLAYMFYEDF